MDEVALFLHETGLGGYLIILGIVVVFLSIIGWAIAYMLSNGEDN